MAVVRTLLRDLENNTYYDSYDCPIARMLKRRFPKDNNIAVGFDCYQLNGIWYDFNDELEQYNKELRKWASHNGPRPKMRTIRIPEVI